jgi:predicted enzyme related to lactoylglutathione lyase
MVENNSGGTSFSISEIGQIAITVHDLDAAVAFYRDRLGMSFLFQAPNMAFFQCGTIRLMLAIPEKQEFDHPSSIIYYRVNDIDESYETLHGRGVSFVGEPHCVHTTSESELWMAFFNDSEDNVLCIMSERKTG